MSIEDEFEIRRAFDELDTNGNGFLDLKELEIGAEKLGMQGRDLEEVFEACTGIRKRVKWFDMDATTRDLWGDIGWTSRSWRIGKCATTGTKWINLLENQRAAALALGYTEDTWNQTFQDEISFEQFKKAMMNRFNSPEASKASREERDKITNYEIRTSFKELDLDGSGYLDMEEIEKAAMEVGLVGDEVETVFSMLSGIKRRSKWTQMDLATRKEWAQLGWGANNWGKTNDETDNLKWSELNITQQRAAENLGFMEETWDQKEDIKEEGGHINLEQFIKAVRLAEQRDTKTASDLFVKGVRQKDTRSKAARLKQLRSEMESANQGLRKNHSKIEDIRRNRTGSSGTGTGDEGSRSLSRRKSSSGMGRKLDRESNRARVEQLRKQHLGS